MFGVTTEVLECFTCERYEFRLRFGEVWANGARRGMAFVELTVAWVRR